MDETLPIKVTRLEVQMNVTDTKIDKLDIKVDELDRKFGQLIDRLDGRYASKLSERLVYGMVSLILIGVLGALLSMVIK